MLDVVVDIRKDSETFLEHHAQILSDKNQYALLIPEGFAHGFQTLDDKCELIYLHSQAHYPLSEGGIRYDDSRLDISWPLEISEISERDLSFPPLDLSFEGI